MEILAQSSTAFVLTHNFQGTHILGASRGRLSDSVASCCLLAIESKLDGNQQAADLKADQLLNINTITVESSLQRATIGECLKSGHRLLLTS